MNGFLPIRANGIIFVPKKLQKFEHPQNRHNAWIEDKPPEQNLWPTVDWRDRDACNGRHCSRSPLFNDKKETIIKWVLKRADKSCLQIKLQLSWNRLPDLRYCRPSPFKAPASQDKGGSPLCQVQSCLGSQTSVRPRYDNNLPIILYWKPYWLLMLKIYLICVELTCIEGKLFCQTCLWRWQTVTGFNANILCILLVLIAKQINWENKLSVNVID